MAAHGAARRRVQVRSGLGMEGRYARDTYPYCVPQPHARRALHGQLGERKRLAVSMERRLPQPHGFELLLCTHVPAHLL